jgi:drug/metabolite transporter (DMT)-like permease
LNAPITADSPPELRDYLRLHFFVWIVGFTAILGHFIRISAVSLTLWRTAIAAGVMLIWVGLRSRQSLRLKSREVWPLLGTGVILGMHWICFYGALKLSNVSICLTGMAATSLFSSWIDPWITRRPFRRDEFWIGLMIIGGLSLVLTFAFEHWLGLLVAVLAAFLASVFPCCNRVWVKRGLSSRTITTYEMVGACLTCGGFALFDSSPKLPASSDWPWLLILSLVCTVYAFSLSVSLLQKVTPYTMALALNLEPVYGILLAAWVLREYEELGLKFYLGVAVLLLANFVHTCLTARGQKRSLVAQGSLP